MMVYSTLEIYISEFTPLGRIHAGISEEHQGFKVCMVLDTTGCYGRKFYGNDPLHIINVIIRRIES